MGLQKVMVQIIGTQRFFAEGPRTEHSRPSDSGDENETDGGGTDRSKTAQTQQTFPGLYSFQNGTHFVLYEEDDGEGHVTRSTVKVAEDFFEVIRNGTGCARMVFRAGGRSQSWYDTPFGRLPVVLDVKETKICLPETEGTGADKPGMVLLARALYVLQIDGESVSENTVLVRVNILTI